VPSPLIIWKRGGNCGFVNHVSRFFCLRYVFRDWTRIHESSFLNVFSPGFGFLFKSITPVFLRPNSCWMPRVDELTGESVRNENITMFHNGNFFINREKRVEISLNDDVRPHHLIVFMINDMAVPDIAGSFRSIKRIAPAAVHRCKPDTEGRHFSGVHLDGVLPG